MKTILIPLLLLFALSTQAQKVIHTDYTTYYDRLLHEPDDASCNSADEVECFYFTNMVPQRPNLNRITWKALEMHTRALAKNFTVYITCGVKGSLGTIGRDKINIPAYCWKRLRYNGHTEYYIMPNSDSVKLHTFTYYLVK